MTRPITARLIGSRTEASNTMPNAPVPRTALPKGFSVYLDLLRFGAALMVLLFHIKLLELGPSNVLRFIPNRGHDFVILFFVLSGYVIASAADRKRTQGLREFALDRMARVYSVAVPILVICTLLALLLHAQIDPERNMAHAIDHPYQTFGLNLVFMSESWGLQMTPFLNGAYWSLCYEVMYYVIFGAWFFMRGWPRAVVLVVAVALAGPKVMLLMPCWLLGVAAYFFRDRWRLHYTMAISLAIVVPVAILILLHEIGFAPAIRSIMKDWFHHFYDELGFSNDFLVDYVAASLAALHIYGVRYIGLRWSAGLASFITAGAAMSFTLYLFHSPVVILVMNGFGSQHSGFAAFLASAVGIPLVCYGLSRVTESRRGVVRNWLDGCVPRRQPRAVA